MGSNYIGSAVSDTIYYQLSLSTQTVDTISSEPFSRHTMYKRWKNICLNYVWGLGLGLIKQRWGEFRHKDWLIDWFYLVYFWMIYIDGKLKVMNFLGVKEY